jgi:hypothetical protein
MTLLKTLVVGVVFDTLRETDSKEVVSLHAGPAPHSATPLGWLRSTARSSG